MLTVRAITEKMNIAQFSRLCSAIDAIKGLGSKFDVISLKKEDCTFDVVVKANDNQILLLKVAV